MTKAEVLKETNDDWYGSYVLHGWYHGRRNPSFVRVAFCGNISPPGARPVFRVCAWGNDDMGMEFDHDSEAVSWNMFLQVIGRDFVNQQDLRDLGWIRA